MIISRMYTHIFPHSPLLYYTLFCIFHLRPSLPTQPPPVMEISKARQSTLSPHDYVWRLPLPASYPPPHTHAATPGFTRIYYLIFFPQYSYGMYVCMYVSKLSPNLGIVAVT